MGEIDAQHKMAFVCLRHSSNAARQIATLAPHSLAGCASVAWHACGVAERGGLVALGRLWRSLCTELDGPGYATAERWRDAAARIQGQVDRDRTMQRMTKRKGKVTP